MKKVYLLDTNVVSEFSKERPDENVISRYEMTKNLCATSSTVWQELIYGMSRLPNGKKKSSIEKFVEELADNTEILPYDDFAAQICGNLLSKAEQNGKKLPLQDCQIAATAIANGMVLVTRNVSDFVEAVENSFLKVENWFSE